MAACWQRTHNKSSGWMPTGAFTTKWSQKLQIWALLEEFPTFFFFHFIISSLVKRNGILKMKSACGRSLVVARKGQFGRACLACRSKDPKRNKGSCRDGAEHWEETEMQGRHASGRVLVLLQSPFLGTRGSALWEWEKDRPWDPALPVQTNFPLLLPQF